MRCKEMVQTLGVCLFSMIWLPQPLVADQTADGMLLPYDVADTPDNGESPYANGDLSTMKRMMAMDQAADAEAAPSLRVMPKGFVPEGESKEFMRGFVLCPGCTAEPPRPTTYREEMARAEAVLTALQHVEELKQLRKDENAALSRVLEGPSSEVAMERAEAPSAVAAPLPVAMPEDPKAVTEENTPVVDAADNERLTAMPAVLVPAREEPTETSGLDVKME